MFGRQGHSNSSSSNLVEFRAGRMNMVGRMVHPDTRKGLVYLSQSEDGLMHFCWKDRTSGKVEDDLIVFPEEYEFKRVEQCKTGRVYVLKFKTSSRRMFFWMQEPKMEKDEEFCRRVNELMNNPPSANRSGAATSDGGDLQYMLNNMSQQQLMQLFGGVGQMGGLSSLLGSMNRSGDNNRSGGSSTRLGSGLLTPENNAITMRTPSAPGGKKSGASNEGNESNGNSGSGGGAVAETAAGASRSLNIDLSGAIAGSEAINEIISDPQKTRTLSVHLPESYENDEIKKQQIKDTINSPQFQQALSLFTNALQSAQLGPVVSQFELTSDAIAAAYAGNLEDFVKALEKSLPAGATMGDSKNSPTNASDKAKDMPDDKHDEPAVEPTNENKKTAE